MHFSLLRRGARLGGFGALLLAMLYGHLKRSNNRIRDTLDDPF
jgi:hypothetical protein